MPGLGPWAHHEGGGGNRLADFALVDQGANGLMTAAQKGVRGAADSQSCRLGSGKHPFALGNIETERLFAIGVFAGFKRRQIDVAVGSGNGEVEDHFHIVPRQQRVYRHRRYAELGFNLFRRIGVQVRAADELQHVECRRGAQIGGADGAAADETDAHRFHVQKLLM